MMRPQSENAFDATAALAGLWFPDATATAAHEHFWLAQHLKLTCRDDKVCRHFAKASCLHPSSWSMFRQATPEVANGTAPASNYWARFETLSNLAYLLPIDINGMSGDR